MCHLIQSLFGHIHFPFRGIAFLFIPLLPSPAFFFCLFLNLNFTNIFRTFCQYKLCFIGSILTHHILTKMLDGDSVPQQKVTQDILIPLCALAAPHGRSTVRQCWDNDNTVKCVSGPGACSPLQAAGSEVTWFILISKHLHFLLVTW